MKLATSGQALIKREAKKTGHNAHVISSEEKTIPLEPFTTDEVHAQVAGDMKITMSENYHSVSVGVYISIPVDPTPLAVQDGLTWCFMKAEEFLNKEAAGARKALRQLAGRE
jgi:hypothetical protein